MEVEKPKNAPSSPPPVYLLTGSDSFTKKEYEEKLVSKISESFASSETISFYGSESTPDEVINELLSGSLFNAHKIISVKQAERLFEDKDSEFAQFISDYLSRDDYPASLILTTDKDKIKGLKSVPGKNFKPPYESKMPRWIKSRVKARGKSITTEGAALIVFRCGRNLQAVSSEIEKVLLAYPDVQTIGIEEIKNVAGTYKKDDIFGYLDALLDSDKKTALKILNNLIDFGAEPVKVVAMLKWKLQQLIKSRILMDRGLNEKQIIKKLKLRPAFLYRGLCGKLKKFPLSKLIESYEGLKETDIKLKTTSADEKLVLEKFTLKLLSG